MPTAEDVKVLRESEGVSLKEAYALLERQERRIEFEALRSTGTLEEKVDWLLSQFADEIYR